MKVDPNPVKTTHQLYRPTATVTILGEKVKLKGARRPPIASCRRSKEEKAKKIEDQQV